ncbi:MAG: S9 family peptidase [Armatimonadota bacterium]
MAKRKVIAEDLLAIKLIGDPQVSPDGTKCVFTVKTIDSEKNRYLSHLWLADLQTGELRQFTFGEVSDAAPRWSPDGSKIAFTFRPTHPDWTQEARKKRQETGKSNPPRVITRLFYRLDGFGFLDMRQHIWVCDAKTGEAKQITDGDYDDYSPAWSPDGSKIAFVSNRSDDPEEKPYEVDIWLVSPEGGELTKVPTPTGYKGNIAWSHNGEWIAYIGHESKDDPWVPRNDKVWIVNPKTGEVRCLTESLDRDVGNVTLSDMREAFTGGGRPVWNAGNDQVFFTVSDKGNCHLYTADLNGNWQPLTDGTMDIYAFSADKSASVFVLALSKPTLPGELFTLRLQSASVAVTTELQQLTRLNTDWLDKVQLSEPEEVWFESFDGTKIQGWLLKPPDFEPTQKYPLLLYIHGGPHAQYGNTFFHEFQFHAARGYIVFYTNPRGSMGYEENFAAIIRGNWGDVDFKDIMAAADFAASLPYVDEARMAVAGGSYGGYMTNWIVTHTDRFKCAVTDRSVVDLVSMAGTSDYPFKPDGYWQGNFWDRPEKLWEQSPLRYAANVKTPLLIIHSEGDLRCPIGQAEELFAALKRLKKEVVFVRYPQETSHGLSRSGPPDLRIDRLNRICEWLDKWCK